MQLHFKTYQLQLKHQFSIAGNSRTSTPIVLSELHHEGLIGYGEASLPPYLLETQESVIRFLSKLKLEAFTYDLQLDEIMEYVNSMAEANFAAKACIDIALHDLIGKIEKKSCASIIGSDKLKMPETSFTIGIDSAEVIKAKVKEAQKFKVLKVKLGGNNDKEIIEAIRQVSYKPLSVDANQGWKDKHQALDMIYWLRDEGVKFVEQPMPKEMQQEMIWLSENSPLPLIADESCQGYDDLNTIQGLFKGVNIKLMKCGGIREAIRMIKRARELDLKILMGCMNESSCAIMAAASIAPLCNWADLDGPFLINNNPFKDPEIREGKLIITEKPGFGIELANELN